MQNTQNKVHSIYALLCPKTKRVRYVGCTAQEDITTRVLQLSFEEREVSKWIQEQTPIIAVLETTDDKPAAHRREMYWIKRFFSEGEPLFNIRGSVGALPEIRQQPVLNLKGKLNGSKSIKKLLEETKNKVA